MVNLNFYTVLPLALLVVWACVLLVADLFIPKERKSLTAGLAALGLAVTLGFAHLGGATLDNEENYLIKKLFTGGLGMVAISNQARI